MKILLLNPPLWCEYGIQLNFNPNMGLAYLASMLRDKHDCTIIDAEALKASYDDLESWFKRHTFDCIIVTSTTLSYNSMIKVCKIAKKHNIKTIIGGPHASALPEESLHESGANVCVVGEGENVIESVVNDIGSMRSDDSMIVNGSIVSDLDFLPFPSRDLMIPKINSEYYIGNDPRIVLPESIIVSMRGCPHNCVFCSHPIYKNMRTRRHSPERVVEEIKILKNKYNIRSIFFYDDEWIGQSKKQNEWIMSVCEEIINNGLNDIYFKVQGRCSEKYVTSDLLDLMWAANFRLVMLGCESGSDKVLSKNKKDITVKDIVHTVRLLSDKRIDVYSFWMVGMPFSTSSDEAMTYELIKQLSLFLKYRPQVTVCSPLPGCEMWDLYKKNGWLKNADFVDFNQHKVVAESPFMSADEIVYWKNKLLSAWSHNKKC